MRRVEVGVVGGGIHGISAAYHLAAQAVRVHLFERGAPASGPTGRSSAVCRGYYTNSFLAQVANDSLEFFRTFAERTSGGDAGFRMTGTVYLHPQDDLVEAMATASKLNQLGTEIEVLRGDRLRSRCDGFDLTDVAVGIWEARAGYADPSGTCQGLYQRALELGLTASLYSDVAGVRSLPGGGAVVTTQTGEATECARLLIAAGPWTRRLAAMVGVDLPLTVERHVVATYDWGGAAPIPFSFADLLNGFYVKPEGTGLFIAGSLHPAARADPDHFNQNIRSDEIHDLATNITRRVPPLSAARSRGGWASLYDVSPDWQPVIGEIADGIFVDAGTSGHGFKLGPAMGRYVADLICGHPDSGLEQFHPGRFSAHHELDAGYRRVRILG